jgi:hypothetical protein
MSVQARETLVQTIRDRHGRQVDRIIVPGIPPEQRHPGPVAVPTRSTVMLDGVPAFDWSYGCSATSAAMMAGYYDRLNYTNMYAGSTNGGLMPLDNSTWGEGECPLSATHYGYDGLTSDGHADRFWTGYGNSGDDPFGTGNPTSTYMNCTGDYMGTNQDWWNNSDGSTTFYNNTDGSILYDYTDCETESPRRRDGCHGMKLFFESRGYTVTENYSQYIVGHNGLTTGFTYDDYKALIDEGIPVLIQVTGHTMLGIGYESTSSTIYVHDTWDYSTHTMTWGGTYSDLQQYGVSVVRLQPVTPPSTNSILVWEPSVNSCNSGTYIHQYLTSNGYAHDYTTTFPSSLLDYEIVFLSYGNWNSGYSAFTDAMAAEVAAFLQAGGKLYLDGSDALGYDQADDTTLLGLLGIGSAADGSSQALTALSGQTGTITEGMYFTSTTQSAVGYIDKYTVSTGQIAFVQGSYGTTGVQYSGSYGQKTFCFSYALAGLVDGTTPSQKSVFMERLLDFFGASGLTLVPGTLTGWGRNSSGQATVPDGSDYVMASGGLSHTVILKSDGSLHAWGDNTFGQTTVPIASSYRYVDAGANFNVAITNTGSLAAWGQNNAGQTTVPAGSGFKTVSAGTQHAVALKSDGTLVAWGDNTYGQTTVPTATTYTAIATGNRFSLALTSAGAIVFWGENANGLGTVPTGTFTAIAAGYNFALALRTDGSLVAWGNNLYGQCNVPSGSFTTITTGMYHALALKADGTVAGWGQNLDGQTTCPGNDTFFGVAAGAYHSFAFGLTSVPEDAYEPDNTLATAQPIATGETQLHSISTAGEHDWLRATLGSGRHIVEMNFPTRSYLQCRVYDSEMHLLGSDSGSDGTIALNFQTDRTTIYFDFTASVLITSYSCIFASEPVMEVETTYLPTAPVIGNHVFTASEWRYAAETPLLPDGQVTLRMVNTSGHLYLALIDNVSPESANVSSLLYIDSDGNAAWDTDVDSDEGVYFCSRSGSTTGTEFYTLYGTAPEWGTTESPANGVNADIFYDAQLGKWVTEMAFDLTTAHLPSAAGASFGLGLVCVADQAGSSSIRGYYPEEDPQYPVRFMRVTIDTEMAVNAPVSLSGTIDEDGALTLHWKGAGAETTFNDTFNEAELAWMPLSGTWNTAGGSYHATFTGTASAGRTTDTYSSYIYNARMAWTAENTGQVGLVLNGISAPIGSGDGWESGYLFLIDQYGRYMVKKLQDGVSSSLIEWTNCPSLVVGGSWNTLEVTMIDGYFDLYINGEYVNSLEDATLTSGQVGVVMFTDTPGQTGSAAIDTASLTTNVRGRTRSNVRTAGNTRTTLPGRDFLGYEVLRDGASVSVETDSTYTTALTATGTYSFAVRALYAEGTSEPTPALDVYVLAPADIRVNPNSLSLTGAPGETSTSTTMTVANVGEKDLSFSTSTHFELPVRTETTIIEAGRGNAGTNQRSVTAVEEVHGLTRSGILVYLDHGDSSYGPIDDILNDMGIAYTVYYEDVTGFQSAISAQNWDMIICDHNNYYGIGNCWSELETYVENGGKLLLTSFDIDGSNSETTTLWNTIGLLWTTSLSSAVPSYLWDTSHPIFNQPNSVPSGITPEYEYSDNGDLVTAISGLCIAGNTSVATTGHGTIFVSGSYPVIVNSSLFSGTTSDLDSDGINDAYELYQNEIEYLIGGTASRVTVSPETGIIAGGDSRTLTVNVDTTDLEAGVYNGSITVTSNDPDTPNITIPFTLEVITSIGTPQITSIRVRNEQLEIEFPSVPYAQSYRILMTDTLDDEFLDYSEFGAFTTTENIIRWTFPFDGGDFPQLYLKVVANTTTSRIVPQTREAQK